MYFDFRFYTLYIFLSLISLLFYRKTCLCGYVLLTWPMNTASMRLLNLLCRFFMILYSYLHIYSYQSIYLY